MNDYGNPNTNVARTTTVNSQNESESEIQVFDLSKKIISHQEANNRYANDFSKIAKSSTQLNLEQIKEKYDKLYYDIPINGAQSHKSITEQSYNFLFEGQNKILDRRIEVLLEKLGQRNKLLNELQNPNSVQHPIYENGSFLIAGVNGEKYQDMDTVYIMQEGRLRAFNEQGESNIYMTVRRLLGLPEDFSGLTYVTLDQLNEIPRGKDISQFSDLNLIGPIMYEENPDDILGAAAYYTVKFFCEGKEVEDVNNIVLGDDPEAVSQFILQPGGCQIHYISDEFVNDSIGPEIKELQLNRGESETIKVLRSSDLNDDAGFGLSNIPANIQEFYDQFGSPETQVLLNGEPVDEYVKLWGEGQHYNSIVYAEGRIFSQEEYDADISNEFFVQDTSRRLFNGLGSNFEVVPRPLDYGEEFFGNVRRIYNPGLDLWGSLNQNEELQENFLNPDYNYYQKKVQRNEGINLTGFIKALAGDFAWLVPEVRIFQGREFNVYGQPIIRYDNDYYVILKGDFFGIRLYIKYVIDQSIGFNFFLLYRLRDGDFKVKRHTRLDDASVNIGLNFDSSGQYKSIRYGGANLSKISFIGLQGYQLNGYDGTGNYFNPENGGSNTQLTYANQNPHDENPCPYSEYEVLQYYLANNAFPEGCDSSNLPDN